MAVYTHLGAEQIADLIERFDVGTLRSVKGIAEGVSNSNWLLETSGTDGTGQRFILTMYEFRIDTDELPYFLGLLDHLAAKGCPVPRTIHDREGNLFRTVGGKCVALIEYLPGVSVSQPTPAQAEAVGRALARLHLAGADFPASRANAMDHAESRRLLDACTADGLTRIDPALPGMVESALARVAGGWPADLPQSVIHADLFPDNVLMLHATVTGLIDFYFACNDVTAYDMAVTHAAWCFSDDGQQFEPALSRALMTGYETVRPFSDAERAALPLLASAACLRFVASRAYDWLNTPRGALVMPKDPMAFARRLDFYAQPANAAVFA